MGRRNLFLFWRFSVKINNNYYYFKKRFLNSETMTADMLACFMCSSIFRIPCIFFLLKEMQTGSCNTRRLMHEESRTGCSLQCNFSCFQMSRHHHFLFGYKWQTTGINSHNYEITKFWCAVHDSLVSRWRRGANPSTLNAKDNILVPKVTAYQNQTLNPASRTKDIQKYYKAGIIIIIMVFSHTLIMGELCLFKIPTFCFLLCLSFIVLVQRRKSLQFKINK